MVGPVLILSAMKFSYDLAGSIASVFTVSNHNFTRNNRCVVARTFHRETTTAMGEIVNVFSVMSRQIVVVNHVDISMPSLFKVTALFEANDLS